MCALFGVILDDSDRADPIQLNLALLSPILRLMA